MPSPTELVGASGLPFVPPTVAAAATPARVEIVGAAPPADRGASSADPATARPAAASLAGSATGHTAAPAGVATTPGSGEAAARAATAIARDRDAATARRANSAPAASVVDVVGGVTAPGAPATVSAAATATTSRQPAAPPAATIQRGPAPPTPVLIGAPSPLGQAAAAAQGDGGTLPDPGIATPRPTVAPPTPVSAGANHGLTLGNPLAVRSGPIWTIGLPVTNTSAATKTAQLRLTYQSGDQTVVATGVANDVPPNGTRVALLIALDDVPTTYGRLSREVVAVLREGAGPAERLQVGPPVHRDGQVLVDVRNGDATARTASLTAGFFKGDDLTGFARGIVRDLLPGQSRQVTLYVVGAGASADATRGAATSPPLAYDRIVPTIDVVE